MKLMNTGSIDMQKEDMKTLLQWGKTFIKENGEFYQPIFFIPVRDQMLVIPFDSQDQNHLDAARILIAKFDVKEYYLLNCSFSVSQLKPANISTTSFLGCFTKIVKPSNCVFRAPESKGKIDSLN